MEQSIINLYGNLTPPKILRYLVEGPFYTLHQETGPYTFIVLGRVGPTGKTWLCTGLKNYGYDSFEIMESVYGLIDFRDGKNHVIKNDADRTVIVVLNESWKLE